MIDFNEMVKRQQEGIREVESLEADEKDILKHYCSLATEQLLRFATERDAPVDEVVINAFRTGIGLGLQLKIVNGELLGRQ